MSDLAASRGAVSVPRTYTPVISKDRGLLPYSALDADEVRNDYSQHFIDTGQRPQNFIRDQTVEEGFAEYPRLARLLAAKDDMASRRTTPPMHVKADLRTFDLTNLEMKFDVILVDPPWEEYARRAAPYATSERQIDVPWTYEDIERLQIEEVADVPSFIFLWCGSGGRMAEDVDRGFHLDDGRRLLQKWGYRRCEDICWLKTNKAGTQVTYAATNGLLARTKEHCLMGIKGDVRRSRDGHLIHANVHTDLILAEQSEDPLSTAKPTELYKMIEHFCLGRRRLELFGADHNIRPGWVTIGRGVSMTNYDVRVYRRWMEEGGVNPDGTPCPGHLLGSTREIEDLRPRTPPAQSSADALSGVGGGECRQSRRRTFQDVGCVPDFTPTRPGRGPVSPRLVAPTSFRPRVNIVPDMDAVVDGWGHLPPFRPVRSMGYGSLTVVEEDTWMHMPQPSGVDMRTDMVNEDEYSVVAGEWMRT